MYVKKTVLSVIVILLFSGLLISGCALSSATSVKFPSLPDQTGKLKAMNETAEKMYQLAKEGKFMEARDRLEQFANQMTNVTYQSVTTADGLNALAELVSDSRKIYNRVRFSPKEGKLASAKLRLAADALEHKAQPMWLQYNRVLGEDAERLKAVLNRNDSVEAAGLLQTFHDHYSIIRPAVRISRDSALIEKVDSWFVYMKGVLTPQSADLARAKEGISHTDHLLAELFGGRDSATIGEPMTDRAPILWASMLAAAIVTVLVYVGWKKYKFIGG